MKKIKLLLLPLIACGAISCGVQFNDDDEEDGKGQYVPSETIQPDTSVNGSLNIRFFKKGFGEEWLGNAIDAFKIKYPNVKVDKSYSVRPDDIYGQIVGGIEDKYDLYMTEASIMDYRSLFVSLDDVYEANATDESIKIKDRIEESYFESCSDENGHFYTIPAYCGAYGFAYNREYVSDSQIPVTTDELISLCNQIKSQAATPLVYSGGDSSVYLNFLYSSLAAQYEGKEAYTKAQYGRVWNGTKYTTDVSSAYLDGHLKAGKVLEDLYWGDKFASSQCTGYNANAAQLKLLQPGTAMMFVGSWLMTEMETAIKNYGVNVNDYGMFKAPVISAIREKCPSIENDAELSALIKSIDNGGTSLSGTGFEVSQADFDHVKKARNFVYVGSEGSRFVITKKGKNPELAKLFLKFYYSKFGIDAVNQAKAGNYVPIKAANTDLEKYNNNKFLKDAYKILSQSDKFFNIPAAKQAVSPYLYMDSNYENKFGASNPADRRTAQELFDAKKTAWTADGNKKYKYEMDRKGYSLD